MSSKVYGGNVSIVCFPSGRMYALIEAVAPKGDDSDPEFVGPWRWNRDDAIRDAAGWLEDQGYVHPMTHDVVKR